LKQSNNNKIDTLLDSVLLWQTMRKLNVSPIKNNVLVTATFDVKVVPLRFYIS
jgi:hypothetical protein